MPGRFSLAVLFALMPAAAAAADMTAPVRSIMEVATAMWSDAGPDGADYFDDAHIGLFSKAFQAAYKAAAANPALEGEESAGSPFDYDAVTGGQDGCPLEDLAIKTAGEKAGVSDVVVSFKNYGCFEGADEATRAYVTVVHFDVVTEGGKPVIADFHRRADNGWDSVLGELKTVAGGR